MYIADLGSTPNPKSLATPLHGSTLTKPGVAKMCLRRFHDSVQNLPAILDRRWNRNASGGFGHLHVDVPYLIAT